MLPPLGAVLSAPNEYSTRHASEPRTVPVTPRNIVRMELPANPPGTNRIGSVSISRQMHMAKGLSLFAETIGALLKINHREGETLIDYTRRLGVALRALDATQRSVLEQRLNQIVRGMTLHILAEILDQPHGAEAKHLTKLRQSGPFSDRDPLARSVVSSYRQNAATDIVRDQTASRSPIRQNSSGPPGTAIQTSNPKQVLSANAQLSQPVVIKVTVASATIRENATLEAIPSYQAQKMKGSPGLGEIANQSQHSSSAERNHDGYDRVSTRTEAGPRARSPLHDAPRDIPTGSPARGDARGISGQAVRYLAEHLMVRRDFNSSRMTPILPAVLTASNALLGVEETTLMKAPSASYDSQPPHPDRKEISFESPAKGPLEAGLNVTAPISSAEAAAKTTGINALLEQAFLAPIVQTAAREGIMQAFVAYPPPPPPAEEEERDVEQPSQIDEDGKGRSPDQEADSDGQREAEDDDDDDTNSNTSEALERAESNDTSDRAQDLYWRMADLN